MKKFYGYIRVSTVKQGEVGVSLQEQKEAIERYAQRQGVQIVDWFEERETAAKEGRPKFNQMLSLLKQRQADGVIVHKIDRSTRNYLDWSDISKLLDGGIEVHSANDSLDLHSRGGRLAADIQVVMAVDYIRNLREEVLKGLYGRCKQGIYPWQAPVGYLDRGGGKVKELDPLKAPLVKKAFELYSTGKFSILDLAEELYRIGLRNRVGRKLTRSKLHELLHNPFYIGIIRIKRNGQTFSGAHQPLISKSLFDRVQRVLTGKWHRAVHRHEFMFRRLFSCGTCAHSWVGERQKGHVYYRCHTTECPITSIREEVMECQVLLEIAPLQFSAKEKEYLKQELLKLKRDWIEEAESMTRTLELQHAQISQRLTRLTDAYIDRLIEKEIFEERKTALLFESKDIEEKLYEMNGRGVSVPDRLEKFLELAGNAYLLYEKGIPEEKRDLLKTLTSNRMVRGKNVELELSLPFAEIAKRGKNAICGQQRDRPRTLQNLVNTLVKWFKDNPDAIMAGTSGLYDQDNGSL